MALGSGAWSVVIPYYNEHGYLEATIQSFLDQRRRPDVLILVDNASTDDSPQIARKMLENAPFEIRHLEEARPGKVHALETACRHLETEFTALADADTHYPPAYLETMARFFEPETGAAMALAFSFSKEDSSETRSAHVKDRMALAKKYPRRCFSGGCGHVYRTQHLLDAGGFSAEHWPFVLMDHEIVHRVGKRGRILHCPDAWCEPSDRRTDRRSVRWTLADRMLYRNTPEPLMDWFFYRYLWRRFERRSLGGTNLRNQPWRKSV